MTLHLFDKITNESIKVVALPLEFVDWMAANFEGQLIQHLRKVDPYESVRIPDSVTGNAVEEFVQVRNKLKRPFATDVPKVVDQYGSYGRAGALLTAQQLVDFFEFASHNDFKVISIGD